MAEDPQDKAKLQIDDDWKEEARREKEKLAQEMKKEPKGGPLPPPSIVEVINLIVMQAVAGLGGMQTPEGGAIPQNLELAKHHIDLLGVLAEKTKGNLLPEEENLLQKVLYELQMQFVQVANGAGAAASGTGGDPPAMAP